MFTISVITPIIFRSWIQFPNQIRRITGTGTFQPVTTFIFLLIPRQNIEVINPETFLVIQQSLQIIVSIIITTIRKTIFPLFDQFLCEIVFIN